MALEDTLEAKWCWDSETGERVLMDCRTNRPILRETWKKIWVVEAEKPNV